MKLFKSLDVRPFRVSRSIFSSKTRFLIFILIYQYFPYLNSLMLCGIGTDHVEMNFVVETVRSDAGILF